MGKDTLKEFFANLAFAYQALDIDGNILDVNAVWLNFLGYTHKEVVGKPFSCFLNPEDAAVFPARFASFKEQGVVHDVRMRMRRKDGSQLSVSFDGRIRYDAQGEFEQTDCLMRSVTKEDSLQQQLSDKEGLLQAFVDVMPDVAFVLDQEGRYIDVFSSRDNLLYEAIPKIKGRLVSEVLPAEIAEKALVAIGRTIETGKSQVCEYNLDVPAGPRWFEGRTSLLHSEASGSLVVWVARDVTERKKAESALRESEERFRSIVQSSPMGVYLYEARGKNLVLIDSNAAADAMTGMQVHTLRGKTINEAFTLLQNTELPAIFWNLAVHGGSWQIEDAPYEGKGGGIYDIYAFQTSPGRMAVMFAEVSERSEVQQQILEREERMNSIFRAVPAAIGMAENRTFVKVNDFMCSMLGYSREELIGNTSEMLYPSREEFEKVGWHLYVATNKRGSVAFETVWMRKDGVPLDLYLQVSRLHPDKSVKDITFAALDITDRKKAQMMLQRSAVELEERVRRRTQQLEEERNKVRSLLQTKTQFINHLSHDLRTPLTPVSALLPLLRSKLAGEDRRILDLVIRNVDYMRDLVQDTLDLARLENVQEAAMEMQDVTLLLEECLEQHLPVFSQGDVVPVWEKEGPLVIRMNQLRMRQVFHNIFENAIKYSPSGGVLHVRMCSDEECAVLLFTDQGEGIPPGEQVKVFDEFYRVEESRHTRSSGLGLSICKHIVEKHHGEIWVQSEGSSSGTTIGIRIPLAR
ncbi:MAG: PAS domain-containing sensor histidine kinase [Nanoarchaeota archaeon]